MTFLGTTEHFNGKNGAFKVGHFSGEKKHNVQRPTLEEKQTWLETDPISWTPLVRNARITPRGVNVTLQTFYSPSQCELRLCIVASENMPTFKQPSFLLIKSIV